VKKSSKSILSLANGILDQLAEDKFNIPTWVLATFNDGGKGKDDNHPDNTNLVVVTNKFKKMKTSVNKIKFICSKKGPERATQGMLLTLHAMPQHGAVLVFTDDGSKNLDLIDDIIALKNEKDLKIYIVLAPKYKAKVGDASWVAYQNISDGNVFNLKDFSKDKFISAIVQEIGTMC